MRKKSIESQEKLQSQMIILSGFKRATSFTLYIIWSVVMIKILSGAALHNATTVTE